MKEVRTEDILGPLNAVEKKNAPEILYVSGDTGILSEGGRVSIVGSRKASERGLREAWTLASELVKSGVVIVSGLAEGIDSQAHKAAITAKGKTLAVLGTPLNEFYPALNRQLQVLIMKEHLAISQFKEGTSVNRGNFPARNRTMALVSDATIIVEAAEKSGTEHQGWEALRLGRPLFIMEWLLTEKKLDWVKKMFDYGAQPISISAPEEVFDSLPNRISEYESSLPF